jgi:hypothetical protein
LAASRGFVARLSSVSRSRRRRRRHRAPSLVIPRHPSRVSSEIRALPARLVVSRALAPRDPSIVPFSRPARVASSPLAPLAVARDDRASIARARAPFARARAANRATPKESFAIRGRDRAWRRRTEH